MKKICFYLLLLTATSISAQISDLIELASGRIDNFFPLFEDKNDDIYGYLSIYYLGQVNKEKDKYSYVVLDKNLNAISNGEFVDQRYGSLRKRYVGASKVKDKILLTKQYLKESFSTTTFLENRIIDIKSQKQERPFYFDNNELIYGTRELQGIRRKQRKKKYLYYPVTAGDGFLLVEGVNPQQGKIPTQFSYYNEAREKVWNHKFETEVNEFSFEYDFYNDEFLYISFFDQPKRYATITIRCYDIKTGKTLFDYVIEKKDAPYTYHSYTVERDKDRTVIVGEISKYDKSHVTYQRSKGFFKIVLDKNGHELSKDHIVWEDMSNFIDISKKGYIDKGYKTKPKEYFVFKDGSVSILTEKRKIKMFSNYKTKTTDFVLFNFDADFKLKGVKVIKKDLTKTSTSDYLYSQKIKGNEGVAFFYRDYRNETDGNKKKSWTLGIITIINGKITQEEIPMSSEKHFIYPYIAKEGYILLREINYDADYDQIRLERLNY